MKWIYAFTVAVLGIVMPPTAEAAQAADRLQADKSLPQVAERGMNHRVWNTYRQVTNHLGEVRAVTNSFVEIATGMHYLREGQWVESQELIELGGRGAVAQRGQHKVGFAANANSEGAIDIQTPDGKRLRSHVIGLSYFDLSTGESVVFASIQDSVGEILPPNEVIYRNAFSGAKADLRYTYRRDGFEQDVILRAQLPSPANFGLNPATTRLEVLTEFVAPPQPVLRRGVAGGLSKMVDDEVDFGAMRMGRGVAFPLANPDRNSVPVGKTWEKIEGRDILVEAVEYPLIKPMQDRLPLSAAIAPDKAKGVAMNRALPAGTVAKVRSLPTRVLPSVATVGEVRVAQNARQSEPGVVIDYTLLSSQADFTFYGNTNYYVSGTVNLTGTTVIEGGTVVKYTNNTAAAKISITGTIDCRTDNYRPAVFTSKDDNTVGEDIPGSSGSPTNYYADTALVINTSTSSLKGLRISYAKKALDYNGTTEHTLVDAQFVNCEQGIVSSSANFYLRNALMFNVRTNFYGGSYTGRLEHVTTHNSASLSYDSGSSAQLFFTNSLIVSATNLTGATITTNQSAIISSDTGVFQAVGAASHYLAESSGHRNNGTTNIDAGVSAAIRQKTTYPPQVYANIGSATWILTNTVLYARAQRDSDVPDLGYHYDPLDYVFGYTVVTNNVTVTALPGTAIGNVNVTPAPNYGILLLDGAKFICEGRADSLNRIVGYNTVQEQATTNWAGNMVSLVTTWWNSVSVQPEYRFKFTEWSVLDPGVIQLNGASGGNIGSVGVSDCQFYGGRLETFSPGFFVTNSLFHRVAMLYIFAGTSTIQNSTFVGGSAGFALPSGTWTFRNNLFDKTSLSSSTVTVANNAYLAGYSTLTPTNGSVFLTNLSYNTGLLGRFYLPTNSPLLNAGHTNANLLGLYHYTMTTNQVKETNGLVDIGFHYVALNGSNQPEDSDGDGIPDYLEDLNGNGVVDDGEPNLLYADSDYDGVSDAQEALDSTNPLSSESVLHKRLGYWTFDTTSWQGTNGQGPIFFTNIQTAASWRTNALEIKTNAASRLAFRDVEANGNANINLRQGSVRFWFKPNWSSTNAGGGGTGTGWGRLIELGSWSPDAQTGWWALMVNPEGTKLAFGSYTNGGISTYETADISWSADRWYQVVLTYDSSSTLIYTNGVLAVSLSGVAAYPNAFDRAKYGLNVGSDNTGTQQANGQFEELETFNYVLNATKIAEECNNPPFLFGVDFGTEPAYQNFPSLVSFNVRIEDADVTNSPMRLTVAVTNGTLSLGTAGLTFLSGINGSSAALTAEGSISSLNSAISALRYLPATNFLGNDLLRIGISDLGNYGPGPVQTNYGTVSILVVETNRPPSFTLLVTNVTSLEDAGLQTVSNLVGSISVGPPSESAQLTAAAFEFSSSIPDFFSSVTINTNGTLFYQVAPNVFGTNVVTVWLNDKGGGTNQGGMNLSATTNFVVRVTAVNDAPTLDTLPAITVLEDAGTVVIPLRSIDAGAFNENQQLTISAGSGTPSCVTATANFNYVTGIWNLVLRTETNASGSSTITVTVSDNGGIANGGVNTVSRSFACYVSSVNDAPVMNPLSTLTIRENRGAVTVPLTGIGPGTSLEWLQSTAVAVYNLTPALITNLSVSHTAGQSSGTLSFGTMSNAFGTGVIAIVLDDGGGTTNGGVQVATNTFVVKIEPFNELPTITAISDQSAATNTPVSGISFTVSDEETAAGDLTVTASSSNTGLVPNENVSLGGSGGSRTISLTPAADVSGASVISVVVSDGDKNVTNSFVARFTKDLGLVEGPRLLLAFGVGDDTIDGSFWNGIDPAENEIGINTYNHTDSSLKWENGDYASGVSVYVYNLHDWLYPGIGRATTISIDCMDVPSSPYVTIGGIGVGQIDAVSAYDDAYSVSGWTISLTHSTYHGLYSAVITTMVPGTNAPGSIAITDPAPSADFSFGESIPISLSFSDDEGVAQVDVYAGSAWIGDATSGSMTWSKAPLGTHTLTAVLTDSLGATTTSDGVSVTVNQAPFITFTNVENNVEFAAPATFTIGATVEVGVGLSVTQAIFYVNSVPVETNTSGASSYAITNTITTPGRYDFSLRATDDDGFSKLETLVTYVLSLPSVSITAPTNNVTFGNLTNLLICAAIHPTGNAEGISWVEFYDGEYLIGIGEGAFGDTNWVYDWTDITPGSHALRVVATDNLGLFSTSSVVNITIGAAIAPTNNTVTPLVFAGGTHSMAVQPDGTLWAWGGNFKGQLGLGGVYDISLPEQVPGMSNVIAGAAGLEHSLVITTNAGNTFLWGWGGNDSEQSGTGAESKTPTLITTNVQAVAAGFEHSLAISNGVVVAWGNNNFGQLGVGNYDPAAGMVYVPGISDAQLVAAGEFHSVILRSNQTVYVCGNNWYGQAGVSNTVYESTHTPVQVAGLTGIVAIAAGKWHTLALKSDGTVKFWGGRPISPWSSAPEPAVIDCGFTNAVAIAAGYEHSVVVLSDGRTVAWGLNELGQLGDGTTGWRELSEAVNVSYFSVVAIPKLSPDGGTYTGDQLVRVTCTTPDAIMHYTTNGREPTEGDPVVHSGGTVLVNGLVELKVRAFSGFMRPSDVKTATYFITYATQVATPSFSTNAVTGTNTVTMTVATAGAKIHYTLTGDDPTPGDRFVMSGGSVALTETTELKARAYFPNMAASEVRSQIVTINLGTVTLSFTPGSTTFSSANAIASVKITSSYSNARIVYTTSGFLYDQLPPNWTDAFSGTLRVSLINPAGGTYNQAGYVRLLAGAYNRRGTLIASNTVAYTWLPRVTVGGQPPGIPSGIFASSTMSAAPSDSVAPLDSPLTTFANYVAASLHNLAPANYRGVRIFMAWGNNNRGQIGDGSADPFKVGATVVRLPYDSDLDGLPDWREFELGTDPLNVDSNGDGLSDGDSVKLGYNPADIDTDGDGLTNAAELAIGSSPFVTDSDNDGVLDSRDFYPTDPARWLPPTTDPSDAIPPGIILTLPAGANPLQ